MSDQHPFSVTPDDSHLHEFTPRFPPPDYPGVHFPKHPKKSTSEPEPIQISIDVPADRLGHSAGTAPLSFHFMVEQRRITVEPSAYRDSNQHAKNWYDILSEQERLAIFGYIMAEYHARAIGNDGFRVTALGITSNNELFIAANTRPKHQEYKKCAETSVIAAAIESAKQTKEPDYRQRLAGNSPQPMFKDFFVMGAKDNSTRKIVCPCGSCTDEIYDHMTPKTQDKRRTAKSLGQGNIYILPTPDETSHEATGEGRLLTPRINARAKNLSGLGSNECLKTNASALYGPKHVALTREQNKIQRTALMKALKAEETPSERLGADSQVLITTQCQKLAEITRQIIQDKEQEKSTVQSENSFFSCMNQMMRDAIDDALIHRVQNLRAKGHAIDAVSLAEHIQAIRCVCIQLKDGSYSVGIELRTKNEPSMNSAEMNAIARVSDKIDREPITRVWAMEMNPRSFRHNQMPLPLRDRVERVGKRGEKGKQADISYTVVPYNDGTERATEIAKKAQKTFRLDQLFIGFFTGRQESASIADNLRISSSGAGRA